MLRHKLIDQHVVADISHDKVYPFGINTGQRLPIRGIGHFIKDCDFTVGVLNHVVDKVRPNESCSPSYKDSFHLLRLARGLQVQKQPSNFRV
ncbi:hypothetical protein GCM10007173_32180 [Glutamicibacter ardleyensis]|uniref:Uncharacterized protein n=1 Tax=Glutamicibacter ardleyensis TaxID=225894 RepID=A0ABQ2DSK7_9MICC|nr:hypothetical protein GCM10007173_32180 [Glutamicibacter ardleyensis]